MDDATRDKANKEDKEEERVPYKDMKPIQKRFVQSIVVIKILMVLLGIAAIIYFWRIFHG